MGVNDSSRLKSSEISCSTDGMRRAVACGALASQQDGVPPCLPRTSLQGTLYSESCRSYTATKVNEKHHLQKPEYEAQLKAPNADPITERLTARLV